MYPVLFRLGPLDVESFWVMMLLGFTASGLVTREEFRRHGLEPGTAWDLLLYSYIGGLVGARLFLLFTAWDVFLKDPFNFLFSGSGWVWYGGLIGGAVAVLWGARRMQLPLSAVADAAGPALPIGQAMGRIGCQLAGDGDYGVPTTLPWGMSYPNGVVPTTEYVHPTPIYEMLMYGAIFWFLWSQRGRRAPGEPFALYLILAGAARFAVEFVRLNTVYAWGLTLAQWISLASIAAGAILMLRLRGSAPSVAVEAPPAAANGS